MQSRKKNKQNIWQVLIRRRSKNSLDPEVGSHSNHQTSKLTGEVPGLQLKLKSSNLGW